FTFLVVSIIYFHHIMGSCSAHSFCGESMLISSLGKAWETTTLPVSASSSVVFTDELPMSYPINNFLIIKNKFYQKVIYKAAIIPLIRMAPILKAVLVLIRSLVISIPFG